MSAEIRPIPCHPGYFASADGQIYSNRRGGMKRLKPIDAGKRRQYSYVSVSGTSTAIHRLVLMAFDRLPEPGEQTRHLDGDPSNNRIENLCWGTQKENEADKYIHGTDERGERNPMAKLTDSDVASMRSAYDTGQHSYRSLSEMYGVSVGAVQRVIDGSAWSHIPLCENRFDYVGERHRDSKLTESDVRLIRKLYTPGVYGFKRLAKQFGINIRSVRKVVEHETWKHVV